MKLTIINIIAFANLWISTASALGGIRSEEFDGGCVIKGSDLKIELIESAARATSNFPKTNVIFSLNPSQKQDYSVNRDPAKSYFVIVLDPSDSAEKEMLDNLRVAFLAKANVSFDSMKKKECKKILTDPYWKWHTSGPDITFISIVPTP